MEGTSPLTDHILFITDHSQVYGLENTELIKNQNLCFPLRISCSSPLIISLIGVVFVHVLLLCHKGSGVCLSQIQMKVQVHKPTWGSNGFSQSREE